MFWTLVREDEPARSSVATVPMYAVSLRGCEDSILLLINYNPLSTFTFERTALSTLFQHQLPATLSREKTSLSENLEKS